MKQLVALVTVIASLAVLLSAQQTPTFRAKLELIQVDVTVLGPDGRPMRGLTAEDFTLLDEGQPQEIRGFAEVNIPDATDGPPWLKDTSPDVRTADDGRVFVFVLDDAVIRNDLHTAASVAAVKRIASEVIERMGRTDVAAVICTFDTRCAQDFTNDRSLLKAAVAKFTPKAFDAVPLKMGIGDHAYVWERQSSGTASSIVKYLIELPGRKKTLIYVSPQLPVMPEEWPPSGGLLERNVTLQQRVRAFENAFRSKVTVYGITPRGLDAISEDAKTDVLLDPMSNALETRQPALVSRPVRSLATETGGFVVQGAANFKEGVAQIFRETGSYYLLGYEQPTNPVTVFHPIAGYRTLEVRVNRPGAVVRGKAGYVVAPQPKPDTNPPPAGDAALAGVLPKTDLPLRVSVAAFAGPRQAEATIGLVLGVTEPLSSERTTDRIDLQIRAFTQRGDPRGMTRHTIDARIPPGRGSDARFEVITQLHLKPGLYALRIAATSERLGKSGSVYTEVEIPDFAKAPLALSGLMLSTTPRAASVNAPVDALVRLVPVVPTTLRQFDATFRVRAFLRVYQGGGKPIVPITMIARVFDEQNRVVAERTDTLDAGQFETARSADYLYDLPMAGLAPGAYLLRIQANGGTATLRRDVMFSMR